MQTTDQALAKMIELTEARVKHSAAEANNQLRYTIADLRRVLDQIERDVVSDERLAQMSGDTASNHLRNLSYAFTRIAHVPVGERAKEASERADQYSTMISALRNIAQFSQ